jgi:class 3 adenylate cyclase
VETLPARSTRAGSAHESGAGELRSGIIGSSTPPKGFLIGHPADRADQLVSITTPRAVVVSGAAAPFFVPRSS